MDFTLPRKKIETIPFKFFLEMYREPLVTFCITPNNAPKYVEIERGRYSKKTTLIHDDFEELQQLNSNMILNTISSLYSKFYLPERIRIFKNGIKIKLNDLVSYKIVVSNKQMKFYLTVPKKWSDSFVTAIKKDWGEVDITPIKEEIVDFNPNYTKAMNVFLKNHYALAIKHDKMNNDSFYASVASLAETINVDEKFVIDYNIEPVNNQWKDVAVKKIKQFKQGKIPARDEIHTTNGLLGKILDLFNVIMDEFIKLIETLVGVNDEQNDKNTEKSNNYDLKYSEPKVHANSKGYKVQIRVLAESKDDKRAKYILKNIENSFSLLNGDNKFTVSISKTKKNTQKMIEAVKKNKPILTKPTDIYFEKEMNELVKLPNKKTLKEYKVITQDNFTRTEIDPAFFEDKDGAIPFGFTLDKKPKKIYFAGYKREWWTEKGRYVKEKTKLDDRSTATMVFGTMGSGKTSLSENQALYTFGAHLPKERWREESKSVIVFDVADGAMITNIYNHVPEWLRHRVIILNHANFNNPIAVNNADLDEFNTEVMKDEDYAYTLAEMEAKLVLEILKSEKTLAMDRWFTTALQAVHMVNKDYGYIEAMRTLTDDSFRINEIIPKLTNRRLQLELNTYHQMSMNGETSKIIQTIENRFSQLERDQKLWDCIAQKPLRDENGKVKLNFRKLMDGDEDGAYMVLVHIPKSGVSQLYRKFLFAHYFTKIWNVALSREVGFAGREYRPETLVIIDEIHQIIDIPLIAKLFIDLFKEPRKYSLRLWLTLHGWSSLAKAGRGLEGDIKQSIIDNGCNLIMLKGGGEAFSSLSDFLQPMTIADFNNLMNMDFCGIFAIRWNNKNHVFQAKMIPDVNNNPDFKRHSDNDANFLTTYQSPFGRLKQEVREDILNRSYEMIESAIKNSLNEQVGDTNWQELKDVGMNEN